MLRSHLDHLVVVARSLETGAAYVQNILGVEPQPGGEHPRMGTHNRFLHLGGMCYLEVIAVDPKASHPGRPRWFQLDDLGATAAPRLATWVVGHRLLAAIGFEGPASIAPTAAQRPPCLTARIETPSGTRELGGA